MLLADHFGRAVLERLRAEHALGDERFGGIGRGVCGRSTDELDYDAFNFSVSVFDWRDADIAIDTVDELLETWDIGNHYGVSVRGIECVHLQDSTQRDMAHEVIDGALVQPD